MDGTSLAPGNVQKGSSIHEPGTAVGLTMRLDGQRSVTHATGLCDFDLTTSSSGAGGAAELPGLNGSLRLLDALSGASRSLEADCLVAVAARPSRLEVLFTPASRSRRRTSRMTCERIALRALASLILFEVRSSSWSMKVNNWRSDGATGFGVGSGPGQEAPGRRD